ncbi:MAG: NADH-quinone oxidoreductase subunit J [Acidiferrobacteraceae bacterium]
MTFEQIVFDFFSVVLLAAAVMVVTVRNPVKAALALVLAFFTASGLWILLDAEFLAITLVLVYVGAVMVLFLFVVMMLDINIAELREGFGDYLPIGGIVALLMVVEMSIVLGPRRFGLSKMPAPPASAASFSNTRMLGTLLYTKYIYPFEIAAAILLVAIIAAIALTMRRRSETKYQNPSEQIGVRRDDRLRIVRMPPENRNPG